jgi:periplasmic copper chaperone A
MARTLRATLAAVAVGAVAGALAFAGSAAAHVTVSSSDATQGGFGRIAFRVPNESDTATTTKLEVHLPDDQPVASVSVQPLPGWTAAVQTRKLDKPIKTDDGDEVTDVASVITWTATPDAALKAGQFQEFAVSLGPLPKTDKLVFKVLQYYSDGSVVRWIDLPDNSGKEPDHPAPILKLAAGTGDDAESPAAAPATASGGGDGAAVGLGVAGLVAGLAGLVLGGLAFLRTRRPA